MTIRIVISSAVIYLLSPKGISSTSGVESIINIIPAVNDMIKSYEAIISFFGVEDIAVYLLFFLLLTTIDLLYRFVLILGGMLPPFIVVHTTGYAVYKYNEVLIDSIENLEKTNGGIKKVKEKIKSIPQKVRGENFLKSELILQEYFKASKGFLIIMMIVASPIIIIRHDFQHFLSKKYLLLFAITFFIISAYRLGRLYRSVLVDVWCEIVDSIRSLQYHGIDEEKIQELTPELDKELRYWMTFKSPHLKEIWEVFSNLLKKEKFGYI